jgi:hypothetical protein
MGFCVGEVLAAMGTDRENCRCHTFVPAECSHEAYEKFSSTAKCADCGHTWSVEPPAAGETAGEPKAHEHDWTEWGAVYHGGHFQWRDCTTCHATESTMEGHFCPECAPVCKAPNGCHTPSACKDSCAFEDQVKGVRMVPRAGEPETPPRPPYAVAYATGSGVLNEIALPGDATAAVTDGALVISHPSGVLGIVHVKPYELEQS